MESECKRIKEEDLDVDEFPMLSDRIKAILQDALDNGLREDKLDLSLKGINDSIMPEICEWVVKLDNKIKELNLNGNRISSKGAKRLFNTIRECKLLISTIWIGNNKIDDDCMTTIGECLKENESIEVIGMSGNSDITDKGIESLAPYLEGNMHMSCIYFYGIKGITDKSIPVMQRVIESSKIEYIGIFETSILRKNLIVVLMAHNVIKYGSCKMNLWNTSANDEDLVKIAELMKKYGLKKLKEMNLGYNKINSVGSMALFKALNECNAKLTRIEMNENMLDDDCMKALSECIQGDHLYDYLNLGNNNITDKGLEILSEGLIGNTTLKEITFIGNQGITDASTEYLVEVVKKSCITKLELEFTSMTSEKRDKINELLNIPPDQREIPLNSKSKSAAKISE